ncbi:MAG: hypothetical protein JO352_04415 [Chloroflexi bacterium]|nr:hypothetical protein [Chloroflexota bacterium]MBV9596563.1 hypothetical protein [Chloroflexota bacterium]
MNSEPRTQDEPTADRDLAYRRLAAVILRLDVATLARELQAARLQSEYAVGDFAHAA